MPASAKLALRAFEGGVGSPFVTRAEFVVLTGGKTLVLDNQINQVVEAASIRHYRPIFSVNETTWWLHRQPQ